MPKPFPSFLPPLAPSFALALRGSLFDALSALFSPFLLLSLPRGDNRAYVKSVRLSFRCACSRVDADFSVRDQSARKRNRPREGEAGSPLLGKEATAESFSNKSLVDRFFPFTRYTLARVWAGPERQRVRLKKARRKKFALARSIEPILRWGELLQVPGRDKKFRDSTVNS